MLVLNFIFDGVEVIFQFENGMLGMGFFFYEGEEDFDLINVGKQIIIEVVNIVYFDSVIFFGMICGGKIVVVILGVMEVVENGDLVNWMILGKLVKGMGGVMDLVVGVGCVVVVMDYINKYGDFKLLKFCILLLIGQCVVDCVIINLGVFDVVEGGMKIVEFVDGVIEDELCVVIEVIIV